jgi:hypothetical protein
MSRRQAAPAQRRLLRRGRRRSAAPRCGIDRFKYVEALIGFGRVFAPREFRRVYICRCIIEGIGIIGHWKSSNLLASAFAVKRLLNRG